MKLATGIKLNCPKCNGDLSRLIPPHDEKYGRLGGAIKSFENISKGEGAFTLFFAECECGLCMFCRWTPDGWEYRVML